MSRRPPNPPHPQPPRRNKILRAYHVSWGPYHAFYASYSIEQVSQEVHRHLIVSKAFPKGKASLMTIVREEKFDAEVTTPGVFVPSSLKNTLVPFWYTVGAIIPRALELGGV